MAQLDSASVGHAETVYRENRVGSLTPNQPGQAPSFETLDETEDGVDAIRRLQSAFHRSRQALLIADDHRRWVTCNDPACELLGLEREAVPWHRLDDFMPSSELERLERQWEILLTDRVVEGWETLSIPSRGPVPIEFSGTANLFPGRHLLVWVPLDANPEATHPGSMRTSRTDPQALITLTKREREVMALVAAGHQSPVIAERLFVSPETIKTHVQNAMAKMGARTRAHAVAICLLNGQIDWED